MAYKPARLTIFASDALLPDSDNLQPATIEVDLYSGKLTSVIPGPHDPPKNPTSDVETIIIGKGQILLPGLIE